MHELIQTIRTRTKAGEGPYEIVKDLGLSRRKLIAAIGTLSSPPSALSEEAVMLVGTGGPVCAVVSATGRSVKARLEETPGWSVRIEDRGQMPSLLIDGPERAKLKLGESKVYPSFSDHTPVEANRNVDMWADGPTNSDDT